MLQVIFDGIVEKRYAEINLEIMPTIILACVSVPIFSKTSYCHGLSNLVTDVKDSVQHPTEDAKEVPSGSNCGGPVGTISVID